LQFSQWSFGAGSFGDAKVWLQTLRGWIGDDLVKSNLRASSGLFAMLQ
jgi:hypothetical protein